MELIVGSFSLQNDNEIKINMMVNKLNRRTNEAIPETIEGSLQQVSCLAGKITYTNDKGSYAGDMILVDYESSLGIVVDDWFNEDDPPWIDYGE